MKSPEDTIRERVERQYDATIRLQRADKVSEVEFLASVSGMRLDMTSGSLMLTLSVETNEKDQAWKLSDLYGRQLLVTVRKLRRVGPRPRKLKSVPKKESPDGV